MKVLIVLVKQIEHIFIIKGYSFTCMAAIMNSKTNEFLSKGYRSYYFKRTTEIPFNEIARTET
jgi:hypothetical protein